MISLLISLEQGLRARLQEQKPHHRVRPIHRFKRHLHGAISHQLQLSGHSNYIRSEILLALSHYFYRWNDCGQDSLCK